MALARAFWVLAVAVAALLVATVFPVIFIAVIAAAVMFIAAVNALAAKLVGRDLGCLLGGLAALGWLWVLGRVHDDGWPLAWFVAVGVPGMLHVAARRFGSDRFGSDRFGTPGAPYDRPHG